MRVSDHIAGERAGASAERAEDAPPRGLLMLVAVAVIAVCVAVVAYLVATTTAR